MSLALGQIKLSRIMLRFLWVFPREGSFFRFSERTDVRKKGNAQFRTDNRKAGSKPQNGSCRNTFYSAEIISFVYYVILCFRIIRGVCSFEIRYVVYIVVCREIEPCGP